MMRFQSAFVTATVLATSLVIADDDLDESKAIAKIELLGGKVTKDQGLAGRPVISVSFEGSRRFNDKYIHLLKVFNSIAKLDVSGTTITDEGLKQISELTSLTDLKLVRGLALRPQVSPNCEHFHRSCASSNRRRLFNRSKKLGGKIKWEGNAPGQREINVFFADNLNFGDEHVHLLIPLKNVKILQLQNTRLTDAGLKKLKELKNLAVLILYGNQITDEGLKELRELKNLRSLWLGNTKITDNGLKELLDLENLSQLDLGVSQITDAGLKDGGRIEEPEKPQP